VLRKIKLPQVISVINVISAPAKMAQRLASEESIRKGPPKRWKVWKATVHTTKGGYVLPLWHGFEGT